MLSHKLGVDAIASTLRTRSSTINSLPILVDSLECGVILDTVSNHGPNRTTPPPMGSSYLKAKV